MPRRATFALALTLALATGVAGWGPGATARAAKPAAEVLVFEAASLKEAFAALAARFEKEHPGAHVVTNAAGSQELRAQLEQGAPADVFASADERHMQPLAAAGLATAPALFACNEPVLVVRSGLGGVVKTFADLPRAERIVVGAPEVPIGAYTQQIWRNAGQKYGADFTARVEARVVSRETNVRQVLAKIVLGEADAGVVYRTDARSPTAQGKVSVVEIPRELNVTAAYPIAVLAAAPHPDLARAFVKLVRSPAGVAVLREAGFVPCPSP
ncbi:MAG TPA: molybdate ABC transporter substrate-binding protein [Polyangia bacterium]|nr:molybdate ABC transporter substrate-binding protein [Polyangia bacterium]